MIAKLIPSKNMFLQQITSTRGYVEDGVHIVAMMLKTG